MGYNPCVGRPDSLPLDPKIQPQFLASVTGKVAGLILAVFPVTIFKNGLTMVTSLGSRFVRICTSSLFCCTSTEGSPAHLGFFGPGFSSYVAESI
jgi:hypothetical protein